jgi:ribosome biogenesis GTPase / thiamine phosphate phosphatase
MGDRLCPAARRPPGAMAYNFPMQAREATEGRIGAGGAARDDVPGDAAPAAAAPGQRTPGDLAPSVAAPTDDDAPAPGYDLAALGWDDVFAERFAPYAAQGLLPARVGVEYQHIYRLYAAEGELLATVAGRLRHRAASRLDYPAVGDWVAYRHTPDEERARIHGVLARKSVFTRKVAGSVVAEQVVAANVDTVFLVAGLDGDFNPRRLERYLILARESGAEPSIVLTKADLADDPASAVAQAERVAPGVPVHLVSAPRDEGFDELAGYLRPGRTVALLGSSGVGKSTIVNRLIGEERQQTREVRERDRKGRHTTTHRELILLERGGLVMDTPGMRELQLWDVDEGMEEAFADVEALALACRFPNCGHTQEPGCAVLAAVAAGTLPEARLASYHKLQAELARLAAQQDRLNKLHEKRRAKIATKAYNRHVRDR